MGWLVECTTSTCDGQTWVANIVDLLDQHTDPAGYFVCGKCGSGGVVNKSFKTQEKDYTWDPCLRGAIRLGAAGDSYQPFVFLVSEQPAAKVNSVWFSYYKDLRAAGGRLKLGYGPGGPPILLTQQVIELVGRLHALSLVESKSVAEIHAADARSAEAEV